MNFCFNITEKGHMIIPDWYNRILRYYLVVDLGNLKQTWPVRIFWIGQKQAIFGSILTLYGIRTITTLTLVDSGLPWLRITISGCWRQNHSHVRYRANLQGNLVPDDSWYLGIALSLGIMSKVLTASIGFMDLWQSKVKKIIAWKYVSETRKVGF